MTKKLPLTDFRAVRTVLEPQDFASFDGEDDASATDLIDPEVWAGIMNLPDDVAVRISDHNGIRLGLMYSLWGDWIEAVGDPTTPDEIFTCLLDANDCFQCANFNFLHGFYRAAIAELRTALELVMIGVFISLNPNSANRIAWENGTGELGFSKCRKAVHASLRKDHGKWFFEDEALLASTYQNLCNYTHSRPGASSGALWRSNGPVYNSDAVKLAFHTTLLVYALCYILVRVARPVFTLPEDSNILFELDWMPDYAVLVRAYTDVYGKAPNPPLIEQRCYKSMTLTP